MGNSGEGQEKKVEAVANLRGKAIGIFRASVTWYGSDLGDVGSIPIARSISPQNSR